MGFANGSPAGSPAKASLATMLESGETSVGEKREEFWFSSAFFLAVFVVSLGVFRPREYYFYGDSWDILYEVFTNVKTIFLPHNEHLIPLFKGLYYLEYRAFGSAHLPYMVVGLALHAGVTLCVYRLGQRLGLTRWFAVAAALIFGFSSVYWEVTGWDVEMNFELSTLLSGIAVYLFVRDPQRPNVLAWFVTLSVIASWCISLPLVLAPCVSIYYVAWAASRREPVGWWSHVKTLGAVWSSPALTIVSLQAVATYNSVGGARPPRVHLLAIPSMVDFSLYGTEALVLRCLTFLSGPSMEAAYLVVGIFVGLAWMGYRNLVNWPERANFWFLLSMIIFSFLLISVIRLQYGVQQAASSRYEYFPLVPLALLMSLCCVGLQRALSGRVPQQVLKVSGLMLLAYYLVFHITALRMPYVNGCMLRGQQTRGYVAVVRKAIYPKIGVPNGLILVPDIIAPSYVCAPGALPLWKMLTVLERNVHRFVLVGQYLSDQDSLLAGNSVRDGGFETAAQAAGWKVFGAGSSRESSQAALHGQLGVEVTLEPSAAYSQDVLSTSTGSFPQSFYTLSIHAKTAQKDTIEARIIFKDAHGNILDVTASARHSGDGQWSQLLISGLSPVGTSTIGVDVHNAGSGLVNAMLDDAILVTYPATVDVEGNLHFAKPSAAM